MEAVKLGQRQIFLMKKENLTKRVQLFYAKNKNMEHFIQYMVAILVRDSLSKGTFTEPLKNLIREVYLTLEPNDTMRQYSPFFKAFFNGSEWKQLIKKLFKNESAYFAYTEEARLYSSYLEESGTLNNRREGLIYHVETIFEDAEGKKHKLTIPDTDPTKDEALTANILRTLSTLTVFETGGVRKFVEFISYKTPGMTIATAFNSRKAEKAAQAAKEEKDEAGTVSQGAKQDSAEKKAVQKAADRNAKIPSLINDYKTNKAAKMEPSVKESSDKNDTATTTSEKSALSSNTDQAAEETSREKSNKPDLSSLTSDNAPNLFGKVRSQIKKGREDRRLKREIDKLMGNKKKKKKRK